PGARRHPAGRRRHEPSDRPSGGAAARCPARQVRAGRGHGRAPQEPRRADRRVRAARRARTGGAAGRRRPGRLGERRGGAPARDPPARRDEAALVPRRRRRAAVEALRRGPRRRGALGDRGLRAAGDRGVPPRHPGGRVRPRRPARGGGWAGRVRRPRRRRRLGRRAGTPRRGSPPQPGATRRPEGISTTDVERRRTPRRVGPPGRVRGATRHTENCVRWGWNRRGLLVGSNAMHTTLPTRRRVLRLAAVAFAAGLVMSVAPLPHWSFVPVASATVEPLGRLRPMSPVAVAALADEVAEAAADVPRVSALEERTDSFRMIGVALEEEPDEPVLVRVLDEDGTWGEWNELE